VDARQNLLHEYSPNETDRASSDSSREHCSFDRDCQQLDIHNWEQDCEDSILRASSDAQGMLSQMTPTDIQEKYAGTNIHVPDTLAF
jgi:hypothetical protein